jgi:hypothetical protein
MTHVVNISDVLDSNGLVGRLTVVSSSATSTQLSKYDCEPFISHLSATLLTLPHYGHSSTLDNVISCIRGTRASCVIPLTMSSRRDMASLVELFPLQAGAHLRRKADLYINNATQRARARCVALTNQRSPLRCRCVEVNTLRCRCVARCRCYD